jgi:hypothetical protein
MNRIKGTFDFPANLEALVAAPLDARATTPLHINLTDGSIPYPYIGMIVSVIQDTDESKNGVYVLKSYPAAVSSNWQKIASGAIESFTIDGTKVTIDAGGPDNFEIDLNDIQLSGDQYSIGVSNHSYQVITTGWTSETINSTNFMVNYISAGRSTNAAKLNIILVDFETNLNNHHLVYLPDNLGASDAGILFKIIVKNYINPNFEKFLMIYSDEHRLIAPNIKTQYLDGFYAPLETMESIEILWDGSDFLVTNMVKQGYVALNAKIFTTMTEEPETNLFDTRYIERNIENLL